MLPNQKKKSMPFIWDSFQEYLNALVDCFDCHRRSCTSKGDGSTLFEKKKEKKLLV
jgi:hypothetical protein